MGSSQRSFDVQPKYTTRPRVTIEAAALNRDIEEGNSGGHRSPNGRSMGASSPTLSPSRRPFKEQM